MNPCENEIALNGSYDDNYYFITIIIIVHVTVGARLRSLLRLKRVRTSYVFSAKKHVISCTTVNKL